MTMTSRINHYLGSFNGALAVLTVAFAPLALAACGGESATVRSACESLESQIKSLDCIGATPVSFGCASFPEDYECDDYSKFVDCVASKYQCTNGTLDIAKLAEAASCAIPTTCTP